MFSEWFSRVFTTDAKSATKADAGAAAAATSGAAEAPDTAIAASDVAVSVDGGFAAAATEAPSERTEEPSPDESAAAAVANAVAAAHEANEAAAAADADAAAINGTHVPNDANATTAGGDDGSQSRDAESEPAMESSTQSSDCTSTDFASVAEGTNSFSLPAAAASSVDATAEAAASDPTAASASPAEASAQQPPAAQTPAAAAAAQSPQQQSAKPAAASRRGFFGALFSRGDSMKGKEEAPPAAAAAAAAAPTTPSTAATIAAGASAATAAEQAAALSPVAAVKSGSGDSEEGEEVNLFTDPSHVAADSKKPCLDDFSMLRVLGKGSYGKVVLVRKKSTQVLYAMKVLKKGDVVRKRQVERTKIERRVLGHIDHPFLMKLHFAFQTGNKLYLVLDYCPGGELFFHLSRYKRFPEGVVRFYAAQLVCALKHLHDGGIIYRDIKPENILLDAEGHVKLGDFGLAKDNVTEAAFGAHSVCGTPEYMAPEVINKAGHGTAVDWWGLGMLMYEMLTGLPPWYTKDRQKLFERLRGAPLIMPKGISPPAASIIQGLLTRNPAKRLGALGGQQIMGHEFFRGLDWDALLSKRIPAPLNPCRSHGPGSESTHNFDPQFTRLPIDTVAQPGAAAALGSPGGDLNFDGFTYDDPCALYAGGVMRT